MLALTHLNLTDREKMFYESEARFVESSAQHYRAIAGIAATELGFMMTALTLSGTNTAARDFVLSHTTYGAAIATFLLVCILLGAYQGRVMYLALFHGNRAGFLPDDARVTLSQKHAKGEINFTEQEYDELLSLADEAGERNKRKSGWYGRFTRFYGWVATSSFVLANLLAISLILSLLTTK